MVKIVSRARAGSVESLGRPIIFAMTDHRAHSVRVKLQINYTMLGGFPTTLQMQTDIGRPAATGRHIPDDPVDEILAAYRFSGPWQRLEATGVANRIYATRDVVLRVATNHPDAIVDARTESIAAPVARQAGILTPQLLAFNDSRMLVDRPFSLWERVHGETLGLLDLCGSMREGVWREVGQQISRLHNGVRSCPDPNGYLDTPGREPRLDLVLQRFADSGNASSDEVRAIENLISDLSPFISQGRVSHCFLHNDLHERNIMCGRKGGLLALIDWGDAGWGDPTLDFAAVPLDSISAVLEGYGRTERLGEYPEARFVWDHLHYALDEAMDDPKSGVPVMDYRRFLDQPTGHLHENTARDTA